MTPSIDENNLVSHPIMTHTHNHLMKRSSTYSKSLRSCSAPLMILSKVAERWLSSSGFKQEKREILELKSNDEM